MEHVRACEVKGVARFLRTRWSRKSGLVCRLSDSRCDIPKMILGRFDTAECGKDGIRVAGLGPRSETIK
jgi:hypothetical protein